MSDSINRKIDPEKQQRDEEKRLQKLVDAKVHSEDLIYEIEKHPAIWDGTSEGYSNKEEKRTAWLTVISHFIPDFDKKSPSEKNELVTLLQKKWKGIRSCYTRELSRRREEKLGLSTTRQKQYIYYDILSFLDTGSKNKDSTEGSSNWEEEVDGLEEEYAPQRAIKRKNLRKNTVDVVTSQPSKKLKENENLDEKEDEDRLFLLSLVSDLKKVPQERKLKLKADLINAIDIAQNYDMSQPLLFDQST